MGYQVDATPKILIYEISNQHAFVTEYWRKNAIEQSRHKAVANHLNALFRATNAAPYSCYFATMSFRAPEPLPQCKDQLESRRPCNQGGHPRM